MAKQKIPATPSIRRLPSYLHLIKQVQSEGDEFISGTVIAQELHLEPIQVRQDLAITGIIGKPKRGYPVTPCIAAIEHFLSWDDSKKAIVVGAGNLATALTGYSEFQYHGLNFIAAFDRVNADVIFVFPNNGNIILTAQQAAHLYEASDVRVIESTTIGAGYASLSMLDTALGDTDAIVEDLRMAMDRRDFSLCQRYHHRRQGNTYGGLYRLCRQRNACRQPKQIFDRLRKP